MNKDKITDSKYFYVYAHIEPGTETIVYVGKGCYGRAWDVTRNRNGHSAHLDWMKKRSNEGYLPTDWVRILYKHLSEEEAFRLEKQVLHTYGTTKFNRNSGERNHRALLTDDQAKEIYIRAHSGELHRALAEEFNCSRPAISMINTRKQWRAATACLV